MRQKKVYVAAVVTCVMTLGAAPAALAYDSHMSDVLTGFESSRWRSGHGSSTVKFMNCDSVGNGPDQDTTHISQWQDLFGPDYKFGSSARMSACFTDNTTWSSTTRSMTAGTYAYFRIDKINGEVSGSGLDVGLVRVLE